MADEKRIVLIEAKQTDHPSLFFVLPKKGFSVELTRSGSAAVRKIRDVGADLVILDAASLHTSGERIVTMLKKQYPQLPVILIADQYAKDRDISSDADFSLKYPLTLRKLMNRIKLIFANENDPGTISAGDIRLDPKKRIVFIRGKSVSLTPKAAAILHLLMRSPGEVISREEIFRQVWQTDDTSDMRSLDVHINWLRNAVEEKPNKPKYICMKYGVGYYLNSMQDGGQGTGMYKA